MSKAFIAQFGGKVNKELKERFNQSPQWNGKVFKNQIETSMDMSPLSIPTLLKENFKQRKVKSPSKEIPIQPLKHEAFSAEEPSVSWAWFGHSALLLHLGQKNFLIDPMLGPDASPIAPFKTKRFSPNSLDIIETLPKLDAILLTHDHYDHLDMASVERLKSRCDSWIVALGVARHLVAWGIPKEQIKEVDWWDELSVGSVKLTFTPSRHFSGRGTTDRSKSLWGGFVFETASHKVYWSGDGGYGPHFKSVAERFGKFDLGFMECGQYNKRWHAIHLYPEEAVQAAMDANIELTVPVHWGGFALALHSWWDPIERFVNAAELEMIKYRVSEVGQTCTLGESYEKQKWWEAYK